MTHTENQRNELIRFIDGWLEENEWRLDQQTLDFALDVRLLAAAKPAANDLQPAA
jgi:hypothetical protein